MVCSRLYCTVCCLQYSVQYSTVQYTPNPSWTCWWWLWNILMHFISKFFNYRPTSHQVWRTSPLIFEFTWGEMRRTQSECYARKVAFMFVSPAYWAFVWGAADVDSKQSCFKWAKFDTGVIDVWSFQWNIDQVETLNQGTLKVLKLRFILCWNGR